jgi:hypothetical protein
MSIDKQESIDVAELLYGIVKEEVDKLNEVSPQDSAIDNILVDNPNSVYFRLADDEEIVLKISKEGFYYKGELVEDVHNVYERFTEWLTKAELKDKQVSPQDPATIDKSPDIDIKKEEEIKKGDIDFMYKWIRSKSGK